MGRPCPVPRPGVPGSRGTPSPGGLSPALSQTPVLRGQWRTRSVNRPATQELKKSPALPQQERASRRPALLCPSARPSITLERGHPCSQLQSKPRPRAHLLTGQGGGPACGEAGTGRLDGAAGVAPGLVGGVVRLAGGSRGLCLLLEEDGARRLWAGAGKVLCGRGRVAGIRVSRGPGSGATPPTDQPVTQQGPRSVHCLPALSSDQEGMDGHTMMRRAWRC